MPELPEVESIKLQLENFLLRHSIQSIEVVHTGVFHGDAKTLEGAKFVSVRRFGKVLVLDLSNDYSLLIHVKLTGQIIYRGPNLKEEVLSPKVSGGLGGKHTHVVFHLDNGGFLYYNDFRKFGWIKVVPTKDVLTTGLVGKLGPEPLSTLTKPMFSNILSITKRPVKVVIMDQERMSGVGNIYANDALFKAKINPTRSAQSLTEKEKDALFDAIIFVLGEGLKYGGASELSFVTPDGREGSYQEHTLIYGHGGETCSNCGQGTIEKIQLGGRGTYFCPICQK